MTIETCMQNLVAKKIREKERNSWSKDLDSVGAYIRRKKISTTIVSPYSMGENEN